jgi:hypothetical protein
MDGTRINTLSHHLYVPNPNLRLSPASKNALEPMSKLPSNPIRRATGRTSLQRRRSPHAVIPPFPNGQIQLDFDLSSNFARSPRLRELPVLGIVSNNYIVGAD